MSGIYAINTTIGSSLANGDVYAPTTIVRRYGSNISMGGNGIILNGVGYYNVTVVPTVTATAAGTVTASLYKDGVKVPGASTTVGATAIGDQVVLPISAIVRNKCCAESGSVLTVQIEGQATTTYNLVWNVEKE